MFHAHADGEPQLALHALAYLVCTADAVPGADAAGYVQPALVDPKRFAPVGVIRVYLLHFSRKVNVPLKVRLHNDQGGTALLRLPDRHAGFHPGALRLLRLGKNYTVPPLGAAAHGHGLPDQAWVVELLYAGITCVDIRVQNNSVHARYYNSSRGQSQVIISYSGNCTVLLCRARR